MATGEPQDVTVMTRPNARSMTGALQSIHRRMMHVSEDDVFTAIQGDTGYARRGCQVAPRVPTRPVKLANEEGCDDSTEDR